MKTYEIHIPTINGPMTVEMSSDNISTHHDQLTGFYNDHYDEIEDDRAPEGVIEDEINQDHANENRV